MKADLKITTALAATLLAAGCQREDDGWTADRDTAVCVDHSGKRVPDAQCPRTAYAGHGGGSPFLWYYLGRNSTVPYYGDPVRGGSFTSRPGIPYFRAPAEVAMTRTAAISRGGFGSSEHGGGEGGGHGGGAGE